MRHFACCFSSPAFSWLLLWLSQQRASPQQQLLLFQWTQHMIGPALPQLWTNPCSAGPVYFRVPSLQDSPCHLQNFLSSNTQLFGPHISDAKELFVEKSAKSFFFFFLVWVQMDWLQSSTSPAWEWKKLSAIQLLLAHIGWRYLPFRNKPSFISGNIYWWKISQRNCAHRHVDNDLESTQVGWHQF